MGAGGKGSMMPRDPRRGASTNRFRIRLAGAFVASLLLLAAATAVAYAADLGHKDGPYVNGTGGISGSKPESKLWYTGDGRWWGSIWDDTLKHFYIFQLNTSTNTFVNTGVEIDDRNGSRADTLWDQAAGTLYVASQHQSDAGATGSGSSFAARLYRYTYNSSTHVYSLDTGFPATIRSGLQSETLVIAKDSTGMLWATWTQPSGGNRLVYTNHSTVGNDASWSTPAILPVGTQGVGVTTDKDDISSIIAFKQDSTHNAVGVFWSNQADIKDYFAVHVDGVADNIWTAETAIAKSGGNPLPADDHINLKTDSTGRVYAMIKNSNDSSSLPEVELLVRPQSAGAVNNWAASVLSKGLTHTRPILLIDEPAGMLFAFLTGPTPPDTTGASGGTIFEMTSPMSSISWTPSSPGTAVIRDDASPRMNNPTSTKQNVTSASGIVVLASDDSDSSTPAGHRNYWHYQAALSGGSGAPVADFTSNVVGGAPGVTVNFSDASTNTPTSWAWNFGDTTSGALNTSILQNPSHQYLLAGSYTVSLTATNGSGPGSITKTGYITVASGGGGTLTLPADADTQVKVGSTTNLGANIQLRTREENPVASSTYRSYLRFNVQGLTGTVNTVTLRLWVDTASTNTQTVFNTTSNPTWPELTTNGTNAPAIGSTVYGSSTASPALAYKEITLLPASITGNGLVTFALKSNGTTSAYFSSKEGAHPPQLVITQAASGPTADFVATTATSGGVPLSVTFDASASTGTGLTYAWDFGDTGSGTGVNPSHNYTVAGTYTVTLTVTDASLATAQKVRVGYVVLDTPALASFTKNKTGGNTPLVVNFDGSGSTGSNLVYAWNFGDPGSGSANSSSLQTPIHTFNTVNTFNVTLTVSNAAGPNTSAPQSIHDDGRSDRRLRGHDRDQRWRPAQRHLRRQRLDRHRPDLRLGLW